MILTERKNFFNNRYKSLQYFWNIFFKNVILYIREKNIMEPLIYIEQKDNDTASKLSGGFTIADIQKRAYINALGSELAMKYLAQEEISVSNVYNLHDIFKIREEFDVADVMLPNIHLDVRMVYDENLIFIPKTHFEYGLTPDIYLVFLMLEDTSCVKFLGFFEPKLINKNNQNNEYYFIEKEKLSHPSDLKSYIENFNGNTTEILTEEETEKAQQLAIMLIDHDIDNTDKQTLIKMLLRSSSLREELIEFDNFELLSYHVVNNTELTPQPSAVDNTITFENNITDEFDLFDQEDEFSDNSNNDNQQTSGEDEMNETKEKPDENPETSDQTPVDDISFETEQPYETTEHLDNLFGEQNTTFDDKIIPDEPKLSEEISLDDLSLDANSDTALDDLFNENKTNTSDDLTLEDVNNTELIQTPVDITENDNPYNLTDSGILSDDDFTDTAELSQDNFNSESFNDFEFPAEDKNNFEENDTDINTANFDDLELHAEENPTNNINEPSVDDKIRLSEFDELPFDTDDKNVQIEMDSENSAEADDIKPADFEDLGEREDFITAAEENLSEPIDFSDAETIADDTLIDNSDKLDIQTNENNFEENDNNTNTTSFDEFDLPDDESDSDDTIEAAANLDSFNSDENLTDDINNELEINENSPDQILSTESFDDQDSDEFSQETFDIEELAGQISENTPHNTETKETVSFENSTPITNHNIISAGEIPIDINNPVTENNLPDEQKLDVLYNENNDTITSESEIKQQTLRPEKGKKALILATAAVAAIAVLSIYTVINKSGSKITEQTNPSILEENMPSLDEQLLPEDNASILPEPPAPKIDEAAKVTKTQPKSPAPVINSPYPDIKKMTWAVPDYVSYNTEFKKYLQTAGKSLKLSLSSDLLLATEYAYSDQIQVNIVLSKEGTLEDAKILQSSGSAQIDEIVLRTVNETLKVVKAPAGVIVGDNIQLTLKIYL